MWILNMVLCVYIDLGWSPRCWHMNLYGISRGLMVWHTPHACLLAHLSVLLAIFNAFLKNFSCEVLIASLADSSGTGMSVSTNRNIFINSLSWWFSFLSSLCVLQCLAVIICRCHPLKQLIILFFATYCRWLQILKVHNSPGFCCLSFNIVPKYLCYAFMSLK